jgi:hypothetical protein
LAISLAEIRKITDQYTNAVFEATIASGVVTGITALTDGGDGFALGDVVSLDIDPGTAGQESATGSGATVTVNSVG